MVRSSKRGCSCCCCCGGVAADGPAAPKFDAPAACCCCWTLISIQVSLASMNYVCYSYLSSVDTSFVAKGEGGAKASCRHAAVQCGKQEKCE